MFRTIRDVKAIFKKAMELAIECEDGKDEATAKQELLDWGKDRFKGRKLNKLERKIYAELIVMLEDEKKLIDIEPTDTKES